MPVARLLSAFVPHDLTAPLSGAGAGSLAGLSAAVKDMYDFAGSRTGGGSPDWLDAQAPATSTAAAVVRILEAGARRILLQRVRCQRPLRHPSQPSRAES